MTCAQIAIIPRNSASDVRAAASSAIVRNIQLSLLQRTKREHSSYYVLVKRVGLNPKVIIYLIHPHGLCNGAQPVGGRAPGSPAIPGYLGAAEMCSRATFRGWQALMLQSNATGMMRPRGTCPARRACERAYDGRACFETGESRSASGGKLPFWRCVPSNQAHSTTSFPSAVMPTTVTVIRGLPDFSWTVSPILKPIVAPECQAIH
jgi:hypothetical protein